MLSPHSAPVTVTKWRDKKIVTMISTYHSHDTRTVTRNQSKPVDNGNIFKGQAAAFAFD
jgi:hypothetical protein